MKLSERYPANELVDELVKRDICPRGLDPIGSQRDYAQMSIGLRWDFIHACAARWGVDPNCEKDGREGRIALLRHMLAEYDEGTPK